jgi:hypothetical protein
MGPSACRSREVCAIIGRFCLYCDRVCDGGIVMACAPRSAVCCRCRRANNVQQVTKFAALGLDRSSLDSGHPSTA